MRIFEILSERKARANGIYCALRVCQQDAQVLHDFISQFGVKPIPVKDMHMTVFGMMKGLFRFDQLPRYNLPLTLDVVKHAPYSFFSVPRKNIFNGAFLELQNTKEYTSWRNEFLSAVGKQNTYRNTGYDYKPHVSMTFQNMQEIKLPYDNNHNLIKAATLLKQTPPPLKTITFDTTWLDESNPTWGMDLV